MRIVIQRVESAKVEVDGKTVGSIGKGALVLFGVHKDDAAAQTLWLANKLVNLRMFADAQDKMNLSLLDIKGEVLIVSQFTLYGNCSEGRRPEFTASAPPALANSLYEKFILEVRQQNLNVETGVFGARMKVSLVNDGPVTFILDAK
ncbi:MAG: D-tyrosyl-tRNA(Tyr) deacylase [Verrucomicrobia bacterium]|nr:D-tyrosyl-tRNA(Tyr) deacylase [Verrucomicrobiota bacterium]